MDKEEQVKLIKLAIDSINFLRTQHYMNREFPAWRIRVGELLQKIYGDESREYRRFANAPGKSFVIRTETALKQEYQRKLDCYEAALETLIEE